MIKTLVKTLISGDYSTKRIIKTIIVITLLNLVFVGTIINGFYWILALIYKNQIPTIYMNHLQNLPPYIGPITAMITTFLYIQHLYKQHSQIAYLEAQISTLLIGGLAYIGYHYFNAQHYLNSSSWIIADIGMPIVAFFAAYLGRKKSQNSMPLNEKNIIEKLSSRETEIYQLIKTGLSNKEIGNKLFISETTVKTHIKNIFKKTGVNSRFKLIKAR